MVRPAIYIALLVSILFSGYTVHQNQQLEKSFYSTFGYKEISKKKLLKDFQKGVIFIIKPSRQSNPIIYKVDDFIRDYTYGVASKTLDHDLYQKGEILSLLETGKILLDPPVKTDYRDLKLKINNAISFHGFTHTEMLHLIEDFTLQSQSLVYSWNNILQVFQIFLILLTVQLLAEYLIKIGWIRTPKPIYYFAILCFMFYNAILPYIWFRRELFSASAPMFFISSSYSLLVYPIFNLSKSYLKHFDFVDREALKFCILFLLICLGIVTINGPISNYYYETLNGITNESSIDQSMLLQIFLFCTANLLVNVFFFLWPKISRSEKIKIAETKALKSEAALNSIQSSVNPHFLYNSLNSIATLTKTDPIKTERMTLALSAFYKYVTNREGSAYSTIEKEIEMINTYLDIEKIRFEDRLTYNIQIQDGLKQSEIPNFLIQPLVENAIKYGYDKTNDTIEIGIKVSQLKDNITIKIFDQGPPFDENLGKGYGLRSVTKKLQHLYPNRHEISFNNNPKHVSITLKMEGND